MGSETSPPTRMGDVREEGDGCVGEKPGEVGENVATGWGVSGGCVSERGLQLRDRNTAPRAGTKSVTCRDRRCFSLPDRVIGLLDLTRAGMVPAPPNISLHPRAKRVGCKRLFGGAIPIQWCLGRRTPSTSAKRGLRSRPGGRQPLESIRVSHGDRTRSTEADSCLRPRLEPGRLGYPHQ